MVHNGNDKPKIKTKAQPPGHVTVITSDGVRIKVRAPTLSASPVFRVWVHSSCYNNDTGIILDNAKTERAEVFNAALEIMSRDKAIVDVPYQCQIDLIRFFAIYKFEDELRFIKSSIHLAMSKSHATFHPLSIFRIAVHLNDIDLCGRILAEMGGYRLSPNPWGPETFGLPMPGAGVLLASAMSFQDMQSLPPVVFWALSRAEMVCMDNPKAYSREFVRLMRLKDAPAMAPA